MTYPIRLSSVFLFSLIFLAAAHGETRHPIVLAHGFLASDGLFSMKRVAEGLRQQGHQVFLAEVSAVGPVAVRGVQLGAYVDKVLEQTGATQVNLIAHSMGGLDARYLISRLGFSAKVASLTTLSTPHRGSPIADKITAEINNGRLKGLERFVNLLASVFNHATDLDAGGVVEGIYDLTVEASAKFNQEVLDSPAVYYQSYGGFAHADQPHGIHRLLKGNHRTIEAIDGANDGMVSLHSAQWGNFRGAVVADHFSVVGLGRKNMAPFPVEKFIQGVGKDLEERGY